MGQGQIQAQGVQGVHREIRVLEPAQKAQGNGHGQHQKQPGPGRAPVFSDEQAEQPAQQDGNGHQKEISRLAPGVKDQAEHQQNGVFKAEGHRKVQRQHRRQEIKSEGNTGEEHGFAPFGKNGAATQGGPRGRLFGQFLVQGAAAQGLEGADQVSGRQVKLGADHDEQHQVAGNGGIQIIGLDADPLGGVDPV